MKLHNTLTRKIEEFKPLEPGRVKLYNCGLTVYSQPHIGNWVYFIFCDLLHRTLLASGFEVVRVQNITDVGHLTDDADAGEDKMLKSALTGGVTAWEVAEKYIKIADHEAYEQLSLLRPTHMPRATEFIPQQIAFVEELEDKGYTYVIEDGVYFDTNKLSDYGKLARLNIDGLQFGVRVKDTGKKNPTDFALWKFSNPEEKRDMQWQSKWGTGFPGWHLECSVMAREILGDQIDIHTGGIDHIPVHHTNEIAQTEALTNKQFASMWVHANHIKVDGTKMSKSLGNVYTLQDIINRGYDLQAFKLMNLSKHYSTEGNFTWNILTTAQNLFNKWQAVADLRWQTKDMPKQTDFNEFSKNILLALQNDLDTPKALRILDAITELEYVSKQELDAFNDLLTQVDALLGINLLKDDISHNQKKLIAQREAARLASNWQKSDEIRDVLRTHGIEVKDTLRGSVWSRT